MTAIVFRVSVKMSNQNRNFKMGNQNFKSSFDLNVLSKKSSLLAYYLQCIFFYLLCIFIVEKIIIRRMDGTIKQIKLLKTNENSRQNKRRNTNKN